MNFLELFKAVNTWRSSYISMEHKIQGLRDTFTTVKDRLKDAEEENLIVEGNWSESWSESQRWLDKFKSIFWDIDNFIDEYETARLLQKVNPLRKRKWSETWFSIKYQSSLILRLDRKIEQLNKRWDEIKNDIRKPMQNDDVGLFWQDQVLWDNQEYTLGREDVRDEYVRLLVSDPRQGTEGSDYMPTIPVVPIYGTAGIGKTTLAKMIFADQRICTYFNVKAWVSLTSRCKEIDAVQKIYECLTGERYGSEDLQMLPSDLKEYLRRQKDSIFLVVIDNLWAKNFNTWGTLLRILHEGGKGSKVLITTCNKNTCGVMRALSKSSLTGLQHNECWQLIKSLSLPQSINDHDYQQLEHIGMNIAERCQGSPMAAKAFGFLLHGKSEEDWQNKLSEMRVLKEDQNGFLARVMVNYYDLPYYEKKCFAYCCMFPNGYEFERNQLIRCWMAEGLIQPVNYQPEEVGGKYFDSLVERSFFENIGQVGRYRMPTLMCDLAKIVSEFELRDLKSDCEPPVCEADKARYVSLSYQKNTPSVEIDCINPYTKLRAFKLFPVWGNHVVPLRPIEPHFFHKFTHIRVLDLSDSDLRDLPKSIGGLMHLRYLGLSNTKICIVPEELCNLINLETIELKGCPQLKRLPEGMDKLINLRHLDFHLDWEKIIDSTEVVMPQGIGKLKQLQTLSRFNVTISTDGQECNIIALKDLNLKGDLCILNLERVPMGKPEVAKKANLIRKCIEKLLLRWDDLARFDHKQQEHSKMVITSLEPCKSLKSIWLINYPSKSFPTWMGDRSFSMLNTIRISNYDNLDFLKLLGQLLNLRDLKIENIQSEKMGTFVGFKSLKQLTLLNLLRIKRLSLETDLPKLDTARVSNCPYLEDMVIPRGLNDKFLIDNCPLMEQRQN